MFNLLSGVLAPNAGEIVFSANASTACPRARSPDWA
jgi:ABC-type branched-subunit amino acid transport system ATPase component